MFSISGMVHFRSKALARTILKIYAVCQYRSSSYVHRSYLLHVDAVTGTTEDQARFHRFGESLGLKSSAHGRSNHSW